jgi:hypothetical protein
MIARAKSLRTVLSVGFAPCPQNLLKGYLHGKHRESWIQNIPHYEDGHGDLSALHHHYAGKGDSLIALVMPAHPVHTSS